MPPNNKKQRGREEKKKRNQAQQEAKKVVEEQQAQRKAEEARRAELAAKTLLRAQLRADLERKFGTPAIDEMITDIGRSLSTTTTITTVAGGAAASKLASSSSPTAEKQKENVVCYHSSSAEHFVADGEFLKIVKSYVVQDKKYNDNDDSNALQWNAANHKFFDDKENQNVYLDAEFTNFVFALGVSLYLNLSPEEEERYYKLPSREQQIGTAFFELRTIMDLGLNIKYFVVPDLDKTRSQQKQLENRENGNKYIRDLTTERGLIKCLHRETKQHCACMATKSNEAKGMGKVERCFGCAIGFLKKLMKKCDGCELVVYCSEQCQINHWPCHRFFCEREQKRRAASTMSKKVAIGSQRPSEEEICTHRDSSVGRKRSREEEPATSKGIVHGTCDGSGNIGSCGHEMEDDNTMTTKKMKATVPLDAHSSATNAAITTATATTTSTINAPAATIEEAREKAATRKKRILQNANKRMNYVNGKNVQDEVEDKTSISNAARMRAARRRRYGKKAASTVTSISTERTTIKGASSDEGSTTTASLDRGPCFKQRKDGDHDSDCSGGGGKTEY